MPPPAASYSGSISGRCPPRKAAAPGQWSRVGGDARADGAGDAGAAQPAIAARVPGEVLLVVVLGEVELAGRDDLRRDRPDAACRQRLAVDSLAVLGGAALLL